MDRVYICIFGVCLLNLLLLDLWVFKVNVDVDDDYDNDYGLVVGDSVGVDSVVVEDVVVDSVVDSVVVDSVVACGGGSRGAAGVAAGDGVSRAGGSRVGRYRVVHREWFTRERYELLTDVHRDRVGEEYYVKVVYEGGSCRFYAVYRDGVRDCGGGVLDDVERRGFMTVCCDADKGL